MHPPPRIDAAYHQSSIRHETAQLIFEHVINCKERGPKKNLTLDDETNLKNQDEYIFRQVDFLSFVKEILRGPDIKHIELSKLIAKSGVSWKNFRRANYSTKGKKDTYYRIVNSRDIEVVFCATAQLTKTPLEQLIVQLLEYCNNEHLKISTLIPYRHQIKTFLKEAKTAKSDRAKPSEDVHAGSPSYKSRLPSIRGEDKWLHAYNADAIPFVGRDGERRQLNEFIECSAPFKIWAIIAPSGAGKTRLIVHWANTTPTLEGWHCRILNAEDRDRPEKWSEWSPESPALIIIDHIFGYDNVLKHLIRRCQRELPHHVRLLVLDHEIAQPLHTDKRWGFSGYGESLDFKEFLFFDQEPLLLTETQDQEEIIIRIIASCAGPKISDRKFQEAKDYLRNTSNAWHPLFAALVGNAIKEDRHYGAWSRHDLINHYLKEKSLPWENQDEAGQWAACFIAVATARRGVKFRDLRNATYPDNVSPPDNFGPVIDICRHIIPVSVDKTLSPFEPDLLGESFFLLFIEQLQDQKNFLAAFAQMLVAGYHHAPMNTTTEFASFFTRLTRNLLNDDQENPETKRLWEALFGFLHPQDYPERHLLRWFINGSLIEVIEIISPSSPQRAAELLERIDLFDFCGAIEKDFLRMATFYSMRIVGLWSLLKKTTPNIANYLFDLWEKNWRNNGDADDTPIFFATQGNFYDATKLIIDRDEENLTIEIEGGKTPLIVASIFGHKNLAELFLERDKENDRLTDNEDKTALIWACISGKIEIVNLLLDWNAEIYKARDDKGKTALIWACAMGATEIVKLLLNRNTKSDRITDNENKTALMWACISGRIDVVDLLLNWNPESYKERDEKGITALMWACMHGRREIVERLLDRNWESYSDEIGGMTPLMFACMAGQTKTVKFLLNRNKESYKTTDKTGQTALIVACKNGRKETVKFLLEKNPESYEVSDHGGGTPLMWACCYGHAETAEFLLNKYPDSHGIEDNNKKTALAWATSRNQMIIVKMLFSRNIFK